MLRLGSQNILIELWKVGWLVGFLWHKVQEGTYYARQKGEKNFRALEKRQTSMRVIIVPDPTTQKFLPHRISNLTYFKYQLKNRQKYSHRAAYRKLNKNTEKMSTSRHSLICPMGLFSDTTFVIED